MKKFWLFFRRFIYVIMCVLTLIISIPINGILILLTPFILCPIYFIFTGKNLFYTEFIDNLFNGTTIDDVLEWFYNKLL